MWRSPADAETALFLGYARVLRGPGRVAVLGAAGLPPAPAVAVRRCALVRRGRRCPARDRGLRRATPEQVRLVVDVEQVGEIDAVAPLDVHPGPGAPVRLAVDPSRLAVIPDA